MKSLFLPFGLLLLFAAEILRVYFIMPFPGSQRGNTIELAYFLNRYIFFIRLFALLLVAYGAWLHFGKWKAWKKGLFIFGILLYGLLFYMVNFKFLADKMFYQPRNKILADSQENRVGMDKLVLGVTINNESRAYPIEIIGYHHQVQDTIGGTPVIITYCTVCRTGRAYSPFVNGKKESFRLVGMDHFNAMFEDRTTKSWWRQATGVAVVGPLKGQSLKELPSEQMRLGAWLSFHPDSKILQPDPAFLKRYKDLSGFDLGTIKSGLEKRDSGSWKFKSWVIGIETNKEAKAYDWNQLLEKKIISDSLNGLPLLIVLGKDQASFQAFDRRVRGQVLQFVIDSAGLTDLNTHSAWDEDGRCMDGPLKDERLGKIQASQEFWHSWKSFHPGTTIYK